MTILDRLKLGALVILAISAVWVAVRICLEDD